MTLAWTKLGVLPELKPGPELRTRFYSMLESYKELRSASDAPARAGRGGPSGSRPGGPACRPSRWPCRPRSSWSGSWPEPS